MSDGHPYGFSDDDEPCTCGRCMMCDWAAADDEPDYGGPDVWKGMDDILQS